MEKVKLGIIGIGNMGSGHARNVRDGKCPDFELVAVADTNPDRLEWAKQELPDVKHLFSDAIEMLVSSMLASCRCRIISTPNTRSPVCSAVFT